MIINPVCVCVSIVKIVIGNCVYLILSKLNVDSI